MSVYEFNIWEAYFENQSKEHERQLNLMKAQRR